MRGLEPEMVVDGVAVWTGPAGGVAARRQALAALAGRVAGCPVTVAHRENEAPRVVRPEGMRLHLSSASRDGWAALAVGDRPVGIDIEAVQPGVEPPWNVLHPAEIEHLAALGPEARARDFARIWSVKEAALKALGTGLSRDTREIAVRLCEGETARVSLPEPASVRTWWIAGRFAVALAVF